MTSNIRLHDSCITACIGHGRCDSHACVRPCHGRRDSDMVCLADDKVVENASLGCNSRCRYGDFLVPFAMLPIFAPLNRLISTGISRDDLAFQYAWGVANGTTA